MSFNKKEPYNFLPLLPPAAELDSKEVLRATIKARAALMELKSKAKYLPNQELLINNLSSLEAKDSSEIENIFTTHEKLFQADVLTENDIDPNTKEVIRYRAALQRGVEIIKNRPLCTNTFIEIVQAIKQNDASIRNNPGTQIATLSGEVIYTPPQGEALLRNLLLNVDNFINDDPGLPDHIKNLDPLIKMAITHYQFEAIHPFSDGNGRTGRIINILYLLNKGLLDSPILFLSRYIIENKKGYYDGLQNVTEHQMWQEWILYMLNAVEVTSQHTIKLIERIEEAMQKFIALIETKLPSLPRKDLVEVLFLHPFVTIKTLEGKRIGKRQTASKYLRQIEEELGLLSSFRFGTSTIYVNTELLSILKKSFIIKPLPLCVY